MEVSEKFRGEDMQKLMWDRMEEESMKRNRRKRVFSIICYIINIIIVFYPWIIVGNTKYNIVQL